MRTYLLCLITILIVSGCGPSIGIYRFIPEDCESSSIIDLWEATNDTDSNYNPLINNGSWPSKNDFLSKRGKPDEIITLFENMETWTYNEKVWCGFAPIFFVVAPLILPVCDGYSRITFENDTAVKINYKGTSINRDWSTDRGDDRHSCL